MNNVIDELRFYRTIFGKYVRTLRQRPPLYLTFDSTYRCNLKCVTCPLWQDVPSKEETRNELTTEEIRSVIDDTCRHMPGLSYRFMGGEPFLRRDIPELISHIKTKGAQTEVVTNGTLISAQLAQQLVDSGLDNLRISVDATGPALDEVRGAKDVWARIARGVEHLLLAKQKSNSSKPVITFSCTVSKLNIPYLRQVHAESKRLGVGFTWYPVVEFHGFEKTLSHGKPPPRPYALDSRDRAAIRAEVRGMAGTRSIPQRLFRDMPRAIGRWAFDKLKYNLRTGKTCSWIYPFITIDPYGNMVPCRKMDTLSFGNVRRMPIHEIHSGQKRMEFLQGLQKAPCDVCRNCEKGFQWWGYLQLVWHGARGRRRTVLVQTECDGSTSQI